MKQARNLQQEVTDRILAQLKEGVVPWRQPWHARGEGAMPRNAITQRPYSGVNVVLLWMTATERNYELPLWMTYKQAQEAGAQVRKGEKSTTVVYVSTILVKDEKSETGYRRVGFLKSYPLFNVAQIDNVPARYVTRHEPPPRNNDNRIDVADEFIKATKARIEYGGNRAQFIPLLDKIDMPRFRDFKSADTFYETHFHELTHWTGHSSRLDRTFGKRFGDQAYSAEELVAELGASFLCAEFGIDSTVPSAAYIASWLKTLGGNPAMLIAAASAASRAVEHMRGLALEDDEPELALEVAA